MRITVRTGNGVYRQVNVGPDIEALLARAQSEHERRKMQREFEALALFEEGLSYGLISKAFDISKSTAFRRVQEARKRFRAPLPDAGVEPCS